MMFRALSNSIPRLALGAALSICLFSPAEGAPINHGNFADIPPGSVVYLDVTESANSPGDREPIYGLPDIAANSLRFESTEYRASAQDGAADLTDGQLNFTLAAHGTAVTRFELSSRGVYTLSGTGTANTEVGYRSRIARLNVLEVDGLPVSSPLSLPGLDLSESFDLSGGATNGAPFSGTLSYDVNAALADAGVAFRSGATMLDVTLSNELTASSEASSTAQIGATSFAFDLRTVPVPEPTAIALAGSLLGGMAVTRRRSSR